MGKAFSTLLPKVKVSKCEILKFMYKTIKPQFVKCVKRHWRFMYLELQTLHSMWNN